MFVGWMHPRANRYQRSSLPNYQGTWRPVEWCPPTRAQVGKEPGGPGVLQAVLAKIVPEPLFWQCAFG